MSDAAQPGGAVRRVLADAATAEARLELAARYAAGEEPLAQALAACPAWEPLEEFLLRLVRERTPTLVYGDYDVDGASSAFMLFRWLRAQGVPGNVFLPSRFKHGYGLDRDVIAQAAAQGYGCLVAVDCGTANLAEVAAAREHGLRVAVVDHHAPRSAALPAAGDEAPAGGGPCLLPDAVLLNPHTADGLPPLCSAGLVYAALRRLEQLGGEAAARDLPELAGLATLADVVPLEPHNWALGYRALLHLPQTSNWGLGELVKASRLDALSRLTSHQAAFSLVPRLNAAGRMASARLVVDLFAAPERDSARQVVLRLEQLNSERKATTDRVEVRAAQQALDLGLPPALALYGADWHPGVLGIVAARVAERFQRPAAVLADAPQGGGLLAGSVRAGGGADLLGLLGAAAEALVTYGGHAQAAGLKLEREALPEFRRLFVAAAEAQSGMDHAGAAAEAATGAPAELALHELTAELETGLWALAPFGPQWPAPRCVLRDCEVLRASYMGADRTHMNLLVTDGRAQARIAAFNHSHLVHQLRPGQRIAPLVELEPDNWNNQMTIMLRLLALS
jgi:single-stranded-DNA-specific exonuclease